MYNYLGSNPTKLKPILDPIFAKNLYESISLAQQLPLFVATQSCVKAAISLFESLLRGEQTHWCSREFDKHDSFFFPVSYRFVIADMNMIEDLDDKDNIV